MKKKNPFRTIIRTAAHGIVLCMAVAVLASGCATSAASGAGPSGVAGGSPWPNTNLQANARAAKRPSPAEDFYLAMNYDWLRKAKIKAGRYGQGAFDEAGDEVDAKAIALLKDGSLTDHDARLAQSAYRAYLDWPSRNRAGLGPLMETVRAIRGIGTLDELSDFICDPERSRGVPTFVSVWNTTDLDDAQKYVTAINRNSFTLGDAAEYRQRSEQGERSYEASLQFVTATLERMGFTEQEAQGAFESSIALQSRLAEVAFTSADQMSPDYVGRINNVYRPEELAGLSPRFPLVRLIRGLRYDGARSFVISEPEVLRRLNEIYTRENLEAMKDYMLVGFVQGTAGFTDRASYEAEWKVSNTVYGTSGRESDELTAYRDVRGLLPDPMARAYLRRYDASKVKGQVTDICRQVIACYRDMLAEEDWLSAQTRRRAVEKLDAITINAVYPDSWDDYSGLELDGLSFYECVMAIERFYRELDRSHTNGTVNRELWNFDILQPNAYYNPQDNSINIILGLLESPFYYEGMSDEELLGGIGAVIGHEISHAFDPTGAQFDKDGNFASWWTADDYAAFQARSARLVDYYDRISLWEGLNVPGSNVQGEASADMAGMKVMLKIAQAKPGFDYRKFFASYATIWRQVVTREMAYYQATQDTHPMSYLRVNATVQQYEEFMEAYGVQPGDAMYLAPEDRVSIW